VLWLLPWLCLVLALLLLLLLLLRVRRAVSHSKGTLARTATAPASPACLLW
jgi:cytochrome c-type biogenesis protein CcmH/NrfF